MAVKKLKILRQNKQKRKICFVITSFIHYSRNFLILRELNKHPGVELHVVIAGAALVSKYTSKDADIRKLLTSDGCSRIHELHFNLEGDGHIVKAKTTGLGILEFSTIFNDIKPDVVVVRGDRFEVLAATVAATYLNITVAHIEGGDLSGTLDESVRHAITKFAHIHFVTNEPARRRILRMGEKEEYVFYFGSPDIEVIDAVGKNRDSLKKLTSHGSGALLDPNKPFIMVMYHPVASEVDSLAVQTEKLLSAVHDLGLPAVWFWPNFDVGAEEISRVLRSFNDRVSDHKVRFMRYLAPHDFIALLSRSSCLVGNSSAGLKECSYLGVPVVNIGSRQNNRLHTENVIDAPHDVRAIKKAITAQLKNGRYEPSRLYFMKDTGKNIAATLATVPLYTQKQFHE